MRRPLITGLFLFTLVTAAFGIAAADESAPGPNIPAAAAAPAATDPVPAESAAAPAGSGDAAAPPNGGQTLPAATPAQSTSETAATAAASTTPVDRPLPAQKPVSRLRRFASGIISRSSAIASSLTRSAMRFIGTPYVFGGTRPSGFDCSGYVQHVYALLGLHLPRTADKQYDAGRRFATAMVPGDLVFFHTYAPGVSHVGIYLGNSKFIHSSSSRGVSIASLHDSYWAPRYLGAKRVLGQ